MRTILHFALLAVVAPSAEAQVGRATVDPGMTRAQVIERLGAPAAERSRGTYTYLFYQNGCERVCGTADLVMFESDTVVDAIFRAPYRHYAGVSSSPVATSPEAARAGRGSRALAVRPAGAERSENSAMAAEFADLLGSPAPSADADPAPRAEPAAMPEEPRAAGMTMAAQFAELLGNPAPDSAAAGRAETPAAVDAAPAADALAPEPAPAAALSPELAELLGVEAPVRADTGGRTTPGAAATPSPTPSAGAPTTGAPAATPVLSPEISELLGNPAAAQGETPRTEPAARPSSILGDDVTELLGIPGASADSSATPPARPNAATVQEPSRPDTIKSSESKPSGSTGTKRPAWPPPRDTSGAKPAKDSSATSPPRTTAPDSTKAKEQSGGKTWTTWPPPAR